MADFSPLSHAVGEGLGVWAESGRTSHTVNPGDVPLSALPTSLVHAHCTTLFEDPLLQVPPARRGNRVSAPLAVPHAKRGEPKGGGQFINSDRAIGMRNA